MRRTKIAIVVIAALALIGAGTGIGLVASARTAGTTAASTTTASTTAVGTATASAAATASARAPQPPRYVVADCNQWQTEPSVYLFTCADAGEGLQEVHWTTWSSTLASGYGTYYANQCTPDCAAGNFRDYPALVVLWGSGAVPGHPADLRYTELTLIFTTSERPPVYHFANGKRTVSYPVTQTFPAPARIS
jgi:hypothetical protein